MLYQRGVRETNLVRGEEEDEVRACLAGEEEAVRGEGRTSFAEGMSSSRKVSSGEGGAFYNFLLKGKIVHS